MKWAQIKLTDWLTWYGAVSYVSRSLFNFSRNSRLSFNLTNLLLLNKDQLSDCTVIHLNTFHIFLHRTSLRHILIFLQHESIFPKCLRPFMHFVFLAFILHLPPLHIWSVRGCIQKFPDWVVTKYTLTTINTRWEATQRVMAAKLTKLTHKIAIPFHLVTAVPFAVLAPGGQSGNFWIHPRSFQTGDFDNSYPILVFVWVYCSYKPLLDTRTVWKFRGRAAARCCHAEGSSDCYEKL
jgi:hypothetical protein